MTPMVKLLVPGPAVDAAVARWVEPINTKRLADMLGVSDSTAKNLKRGAGAGRDTLERMLAVFGDAFAEYLSAEAVVPAASTLEARLHAALVLIDDAYRELARHDRNTDSAAAPVSAGAVAPPAGLAGGERGVLVGAAGRPAAGALPRRAGWPGAAWGRARRGMTALAVVLAVAGGCVGGLAGDPMSKARSGRGSARTIVKAESLVRGREIV